MNDRPALITGASRGIGRAIALELARLGHPVACTGRDEHRIAETAEMCRKLGVKAVAFRMDVDDEASVVEGAKRARAELGPLRVLVNNAGIAGSSPVKRTPLPDFERIVRTNLTGSFLCSREFLVQFEPGFGRIVNIASTAARKGAAYTAAYCAAKHGLLGLTRSMAVELGRQGITVNAICPGWTETEMLESAIAKIVETTGRSPAEAKQALVGAAPLGRAATGEEVASLVGFVVSDAAAAITGQALGIDGGEVG